MTQLATVIAILVALEVGVFLIFVGLFWQFFSTSSNSDLRDLILKLQKSIYNDTWRRRGPSRDFDIIDDIIDSELRESGVFLSWGGRELLTIPVAEAFERDEYVDLDQTRLSIRKLVRSMSEEGSSDRFGRGDSRSRNSTDVVRAFWQNFCNIPPFCRRKE